MELSQVESNMGLNINPFESIFGKLPLGLWFEFFFFFNFLSSL